MAAWQAQWRPVPGGAARELGGEVAERITHRDLIFQLGGQGRGAESGGSTRSRSFGWALVAAAEAGSIPTHSVREELARGLGRCNCGEFGGEGSGSSLALELGENKIK